MVKLICPHCMKPVPVPDDFSGREVTCPNCAKTFDAPARYNPEVIAEPRPTPAPPPVPVPVVSGATPPIPPGPPVSSAPPPVPVAPAPHTAPPGLVVPPGPVPAVPVPSPPGYTRSVGITISPPVVAWIAPVLLTIAFLCTFFSWVGSYVGGYPADSQNIWRAIFGSVSRNYTLEGYMPGSAAWVDHVPSDWGLLLPYLVLLVAATGIAWADRAFRGGLVNPQRFPPLTKVWPWRKTLIAGLAGLAFLLIVWQLSRGFGMERAIHKVVRESPAMAAAQEETKDLPPARRDAVLKEREETELGKYHLEHTWRVDVSLACNLIAVLAVLLSIRLDKRGDKPPPKLLLHY